MRNTWLSPRSAIWEYWTSLIACLFWIQHSCGMPHVIRIGKLSTFRSFLLIHSVLIVTLKVAPRASPLLFSSTAAACSFSLNVFIHLFLIKKQSIFINCAPRLACAFSSHLNETQPLSNSTKVRYRFMIARKIVCLLHSGIQCVETLWASVTSMHSALCVPFSAASVESPAIFSNPLPSVLKDNHQLKAAQLKM